MKARRSESLWAIPLEVAMIPTLMEGGVVKVEEVLGVGMGVLSI